LLLYLFFNLIQGFQKQIQLKMSVPPKPTRVGKGPSTSGLPNASNPARAYVPPWQMNADPSRMPSPFTSSPTSGAPPVPSRGGSAFANNFSPFSSFSSPMANSFGMSPFSSYSSPFYGPYGRSLGMNSNNGLSPFVHFANENARPAFESVEALVMAVRSVSMMVESTYQAVHSSFWAVLGVADHFSKLKSQIASVVSSLSILRLFKWILDQFLIFLRFKQQTVI
jgi:peroxin-13